MYFFLVNILRIFLLQPLGVGGPLFNIDYAAIPILMYIFRWARFPKAFSYVTTVIFTGIIVGADALWGLALQYRWVQEGILNYLAAIGDLPWVLIAPGLLIFLLVTFFAGSLLFWRRFWMHDIRALILILAAILMLDAFIGRVGSSDEAGTVNYAGSSLFSLLHPTIRTAWEPVPPIREFPQCTLDCAVQDIGALPPRILSVAIESLGAPARPGEFKDLLRELTGPLAPNYSVETATHLSLGTTFAGEVRELCGLRITRTPEAKDYGRLSVCLPNRLRMAGYDTRALHGNGGKFYQRARLYPIMGFGKSYFYADLRRPGDVCPDTSFNGVCDDKLFAAGLGLFDQNRRFVHMMTLDTHLPIPRGVGENCSASFRDDPLLCRYDVRMSQTLRELVAAVSSARFPPDLIVVYGDHPPPFRSSVTRARFRSDQVPFLVFRKRER